MKNKRNKDFTVKVGATLMARYAKMLEEYLSVDVYDKEDEFEQLSANLEALEEMGARFGSIAV